MAQHLELLLKYPLISCEVLSNDVKYYKGKVLCGHKDIDLEITESNNGNFNLMTHFGGAVDETLATLKSQNIVEFIDDIICVLSKEFVQDYPNFKNMEMALQEYFEFAQFQLSLKKCYISDDLSKINISTTDDRNREHHLNLKVDLSKSGDFFSPIDVDLPEPIMKDFPPQFSNLNDVYSRFSALIDGLQDFFDLIDEIDRSCSVLDPEQASRRDCYRRIWLGENLSMVVTIDPLNVRARPELKFLGPDHLVQQYYQKLSEKLEHWDENRDAMIGILDILELEKFPKQTKNQRILLTDAGECSICFSLRLNDKLPEVICDNQSCQNCYHVECLYEWLISVNSRRIFNQLHGQCPNCEKKIACPLPE